MRKCVTDKKAYTCHSSIEILSDAYSRQLQQTLKPLNPVVFRYSYICNQILYTFVFLTEHAFFVAPHKIKFGLP